MLGLEMTRD
jgi:hypothetical protein